MSRFNTGNPIDSDDLKDLSDNAKNVDLFSNDLDSGKYKDRFGRERKTIHGMQKEFDVAQDERDLGYAAQVEQFDRDQADRKDRFDRLMANSGYQFIGDYASGVVLSEYNQIVRDDNGGFWRASGKESLPYTTTGEGLPEGGSLTYIGDALLRQELGNPDLGAELVAYKDSTVAEKLNSIKSAEAIESLDELELREYLSDGDEFELLPNKVKLVVSSSRPESASMFSKKVGDLWVFAPDLLPNDVGSIGELISFNADIMNSYGSVQNSLYDQESQLLVLTHTKKDVAGEVGAVSAYTFDGNSVGGEVFSITGIPAGHFSYTSLQRKDGDLFLWFQYYEDSSEDRGIGRLKLEEGETPELMVPKVASGSGHSVLMLGSFGGEGIWVQDNSKGNYKEFCKYSDLENGEYLPTRIVDYKDDRGTLGWMFYQTMYESDGKWIRLSGFTSNGRTNNQDTTLTIFNPKTDYTTIVDVSIPSKFTEESEVIEPQGLFSRWNGFGYDVYLLFLNFTNKAKISFLHLNSKSSAPQIQTGWSKGDWRKINAFTSHNWTVPTVEFSRTVSAPGLFIGSNNIGPKDTLSPDPTLFRIHQVYGEGSGRELYEISCGENEAVINATGTRDSIYAPQFSFLVNYAGGNTLRSTLDTEFGWVIRRADRITRKEQSNGINGSYKKGGISIHHRNNGFSSVPSGGGSGYNKYFSFSSYITAGSGVDYAAVGPNQGIKFGVIEASNSEVTSCVEWFRMEYNSFRPLDDNKRSLGKPDSRFSTVYAGSGSINTSDERTKEQWRDVEEAERLAALDIKKSIKAFKFTDSVNSKGEKARWHFGVGAQTVGRILQSHGLNQEDYAFWCYDEWEDEYSQEALLDEYGDPTSETKDGKLLRKGGSLYGIRYDELAMFILAAI